MQKTVSVIIISAMLLMFALCACTKTDSNEETTDPGDHILSVIDKSVPITKGNLITKTNKDDDGFLNVEFYDSTGNLVENYVWNDEEQVDHLVMKYTPSNMILNKESLDNSGKTRNVVSYRYDQANAMISKTVSEYENGFCIRTTTYDSEDNVTGYSVFYYENADEPYKKATYDGNDNLKEYFLFKYNDLGQRTKTEVYDSNDGLKEYTVNEYNENGYITMETLFDSEGNIRQSWQTLYYDSGERKSVTNYDADGNIISEKTYDDISAQK